MVGGIEPRFEVEKGEEREGAPARPRSDDDPAGRDEPDGADEDEYWLDMPATD